MSAAHTPGPWYYEFGTDAYVTASRDSNPEGSPIVAVASCASRSRPGHENRANARLIAAAPELLEAAQAAWNCIAELSPTQARVETAQMLQAVIDKATGSTT